MDWRAVVFIDDAIFIVGKDEAPYETKKVFILIRIRWHGSGCSKINKVCANEAEPAI